MRKRWLALLLAGILSAAPAAYTFADALSMEDGSEVAGALSYYLYDGEEVAEEDASPEESEEGSGRLKVIAKYFGKAKDEIVPLLSELGVITEEDISEAAADTYDDGSEGDSRFADKVSEFASEFRDDVTPFVSWLADELKYSRNTAYEFSDWNEDDDLMTFLKSL
ncbi:MAG: hypothetical protein Q4G47_04485, partial [Lachnospiraceae bacterium]|nr:hypothetical protein [Lachnospiraceae bacterium]